MNTNYMIPCILNPIPSCAIWAGIFHGIDAIQGARLSIRTWGVYTGSLVTYHALMCPMEVIHGKQSAWHNVAAAGSLGFLGVSSGKLGVPFLSPYLLMSFRPPAPAFIGATVYGAMGGCLAAFGGKQF
ncbi:hypothetical protein ACHAWF_017153 [Thalassiosira exigua]